MAWRPRPNDRFYRFIVRTGLALRWLFRIRVIVTGRSTSRRRNRRPHARCRRAVIPASRRVPSVSPARARSSRSRISATSTSPFAELLLWRHTRAQMRFLVHPGGGRPLVAGPRHQRRRARRGGLRVRSPRLRRRRGQAAAPASTSPILPEAGVSRSFTVRECKTGAVRMAAEAGVPVIPVSVWGAHRLMTRRHGFSPRPAPGGPRCGSTSANRSLVARRR